MAPARKTLPAAPRVYRLKVTLQDVRPPIWRRFTVRDDAGVRWLDEALRGARDQLEEDVRAWIANLTAANTALGHEFCSQKRFSGITASPVFVAEPQTNGVGERFNRTLKERAIHGRLLEECGYRARREEGISW